VASFAVIRISIMYESATVFRRADPLDRAKVGLGPTLAARPRAADPAWSSRRAGARPRRRARVGRTRAAPRGRHGTCGSLGAGIEPLRDRAWSAGGTAGSAGDRRLPALRRSSPTSAATTITDASWPTWRSPPAAARLADLLPASTRSAEVLPRGCLNAGSSARRTSSRTSPGRTPGQTGS
jgi:hypothetical protein